MNLKQIKSAVEVLRETASKYKIGYPQSYSQTDYYKSLCFLLDLATSVLNAEMQITPEQLHKWYLESITHLNGKDYNHMADRPYESLTEGQKYIDKYIADKITTAHTRILLEKEEIIKQLQPEYFFHINRIGDIRKCGHFVQDILSYCPACRELSELKQELAMYKVREISVEKMDTQIQNLQQELAKLKEDRDKTILLNNKILLKIEEIKLFVNNLKAENKKWLSTLHEANDKIVELEKQLKDAKAENEKARKLLKVFVEDIPELERMRVMPSSIDRYYNARTFLEGG